MLLRSIEDVKAIFAGLKGSFVGVGMTGYSRIVPSYFLPDYRLLVLRNTGDLNLLRKRAEVFCLEEKTCRTLREEFDSSRLLRHPLSAEYLRGLSDPTYILPYQGYRELESTALERGWILLANPASLRERVGGRMFFRRLKEDLGLRSIPGEFHSIEEIFRRSYEWWVSSLGRRFVLQLPEVVKGGGKGTFFIHSPSSYGSTQALLKNRVWRGCPLRSVSLRKFVDGIPASVALCLTGRGILFSGLQRQLIDLPFCGKTGESGVFCGHVWSFNSWPSVFLEDALAQARKIGGHLDSMGYKGILGIDFLLDVARELAYPLEINPRFTGAFPMLSMLHMKGGVIPMEAFHILEFLGLPYDMDVANLNGDYAGSIRGSHILLFLRSGENGLSPHPPNAGLYACEPDGTVSFKGEAIDYGDLREDNHFLLVDGPPVIQGKELPSKDPLYRLCRLLFPYPVVNREGRVSPRAVQAVRWAHRMITARENKG